MPKSRCSNVTAFLLVKSYQLSAVSYQIKK